ncbi:MAG TPA: hypothetical protein VI485_25085 [Vicinamibacterales bacterium]|nr:hypothetical protein [Vicinamibacterales bacterium]
MRRYAATAVAMTFLTPLFASAQSVEPRRVNAGADVTITQECKAAAPPTMLLDTTEVTGSGTSPKWLFKVPATMAAKVYAVKFRCPTLPINEAAAGSLEVTATTVKSPEPATSPASSDPHVTSVVNASTGKTERISTAAGITEVPTAVLRNVLRIRVRHFKAWRDKNPQAELHLFLAGAELKNVVAVPTSIDSKDPPEIFALRLTPEVDDRDDATRKTWVQVLQAAKSGEPLDVSIGPSGQAPFTSDAKIRLDVYPTVMTYAVLTFYVFVAYWIFRLGKTSFMLRDANGAPNPPYSLAKHQMAIWFIVVVGAYLYIWLTTGLFSWVSTTALTLIGISGATGLVAVTMDASKRTDAAKARTTLEAERDALARALDDPATGLQVQVHAAAAGSSQAAELIAAVTPKRTRLNELNALLAVPIPPAQGSVGWIKDLVSDDTGVSFHRVQMAVWTLVLVIIFVFAVRDNVLMPSFDNTLLSLMGISSGTYLGFKFPETPS